VKPVDLSIVVPVYHESEMLPNKLAELDAFLETKDYGQVEVLLVTQSAADTRAAEKHSSRGANYRVLDLKKRAGKGGAVKAGMLNARGRYRLYMDADLATPLRHIDDAWRAVRNLWKIHDDRLRAFISKVTNWVVQLLLLPGIKDTQCGFKIFKAEAAENIFNQLQLTGWSFDVEVMALARKFHYKIATFEAPDWHDPKEAAHGLAGDSALVIALREAKDPLRIRWWLWTGKYKRTSS
jgi:dolichyl-phosphate beta-glucosyltransferase